MTDEDLLSILQDERNRAVGFDTSSANGSELLSQREKALNYYNGVMPDVPSLPNRSKAVSTDVADAIRTLMPDLIEIFTGGDDVVSFIPHSPEDEEAAKQETDYLNEVIFQQDGSFLALMTMIQDALQTKTGVVKYWWKDQAEETEDLKGLSPDEAGAALQNSEPTEVKENEDGTYDLTIKRKGKSGTVCIKSVPPEDFCVAADTVLLSEATYCALKARPRAQALLADGVSREIVDDLPSYESANDEMQQTRDTAGEHDIGTSANSSISDLRQVETVEHYVRLEEGGKLQLWRVVTGAGETVLISKDKVDRIQMAAITPFVVSHRFYGQSVADLLIEPQKIRTAVLRGYLDSIYFSLNQRNEVAMDRANEHTLSDLLRNEPGVPIRTKTSGAVTPVQAGGEGFNGLEAMEYLATMIESRVGVVRNAQGLNPDTLHDTAKGAMALMTNAQKRVRLIARIFAETGIKDLFLGVHAILREHSCYEEIKRLRGKWVPVDPSTWGERSDMSIEIGLGSGGKEQQLSQLMMEGQLLTQTIEFQQGLNGPVVTAPKWYNFLKRVIEVGGCKDPEDYINDPAAPPDPNAPPPPQPPPDPKLIEVQQKGQLAEQAAQHKAQLDQMALVSRHELEMQKLGDQHARDMAKVQADADLKAQATVRELMLKSGQISAELNMRREQMGAEFALETAQAHHDAGLNEMKTEHGIEMDKKKTSASIGEPVQPGGEPG